MSLKSRREISDILRRGKRFSGKFLRLVWLESDSFGYAVLVSKRDGIPSQRVRLKRLIREAIRMNRGRLNNNGKMLLLPKGQEQEPKFEQFNADIVRIFDQLNASG